MRKDEAARAASICAACWVLFTSRVLKAVSDLLSHFPFPLFYPAFVLVSFGVAKLWNPQEGNPPRENWKQLLVPQRITELVWFGEDLPDHRVQPLSPKPGAKPGPSTPQLCLF